jgi:hypothetical protein
MVRPRGRRLPGERRIGFQAVDGKHVERLQYAFDGDIPRDIRGNSLSDHGSIKPGDGLALGVAGLGRIAFPCGWNTGSDPGERGKRMAYQERNLLRQDCKVNGFGIAPCQAKPYGARQEVRLQRPPCPGAAQRSIFSTSCRVTVPSFTSTCLPAPSNFSCSSAPNSSPTRVVQQLSHP